MVSRGYGQRPRSRCRGRGSGNGDVRGGNRVRRAPRTGPPKRATGRVGAGIRVSGRAASGGGVGNGQQPSQRDRPRSARSGRAVVTKQQAENAPQPNRTTGPSV